MTGFKGHPGGTAVFVDVAGKGLLYTALFGILLCLTTYVLTILCTDATTDFDDVGHSKDAVKEMEKYLIGTL